MEFRSALPGQEKTGKSDFMNLKNTITFVFLFLLVATPFFLYRVYEKSRPKTIPVVKREEISITIIPGWDLRDIAEYFEKIGLVSSTEQFYLLTGNPAKTGNDLYYFSGKLISKIPEGISMEGYLAPETYRIYKDSKPTEVVQKLLNQQEQQLSLTSINSQNLHEVLTMASILEKEARTLEDKKMVSDILWRRLKKNWALQVDSSVHYAVDRSGDVFTTDKEREINSPWNTYRFPGLPPGPICSPGPESVEAALDPKQNNYWYFLTGNDGKMYYARTLDEHNANRYKYLR